MPVPSRNIRIVYSVAAALIALTVLYAVDWHIGDFDVNSYHLTLDSRAFFVFLAVLPGFLAFVYHLVTVSERREQNRETVRQFYEFRKEWHETRAFEKNIALPAEATPGRPVSANAASVLLTAVFLFVALFAGYNSGNGADGMKYAGIGAYISVLYYMVPRIYASALSSRFLMTSALRSASAVALGWVLMTAGGSLITDAKITTAAVFLSGLFHSWAIDALRQRARKLFGQEEAQAAEVPLSVVKGVDDTASDLLSEYGVTSVQHLATAEPGDLCMRTLLPMDRITGWIDQAILICELERNISAARSLGIGGAVELVAAWLSSETAVLASLAQKASMDAAAITMIARNLSRQTTVRMLYKMRYGKDIPDAPQTFADEVAAEIAKDYSVVKIDDLTPIGRLVVKPQQEAQA